MLRRHVRVCTERNGAYGRLSSSAGFVKARRRVVVIALQVATETGAANAQDLRATQTIAVAHLQHFLNVYLAYFVEREWLVIVIAIKVHRAMLQLL
jgi:hypothetical protein